MNPRNERPPLPRPLLLLRSGSRALAAADSGARGAVEEPPKLRACLRNHFPCRSRREEAPISTSLGEDQSLLTSAPTISKANFALGRPESQ